MPTSTSTISTCRLRDGVTTTAPLSFRWTLSVAALATFRRIRHLWCLPFCLLSVLAGWWAEQSSQRLCVWIMYAQLYVGNFSFVCEFCTLIELWTMCSCLVTVLLIYPGYAVQWMFELWWWSPWKHVSVKNTIIVKSNTHKQKVSYTLFNASQKVPYTQIVYI